MSNAAITWAYEQDVGGITKFILVTLADHADNVTRDAYPSQGTLARRCGISRQTVNTNLAKLEELGLIKIESRKHKAGGDRSCLYTLIMPAGDKIVRKVPDVPGTIFIVTDGDLTKVGATRDLDRMMKTLNSLSAEGVELVKSYQLTIAQARRVETAALASFEEKRRHGDWLAASSDDVIEVTERFLSRLAEEESVKQSDTSSESNEPSNNNEEDSGCQASRQRESKSETPDVKQRDTLNPQEPSLKSSTEPKGGRWPSNGFDQFWSIYPKKVAKGSARESFEKVRKSGKVTFEVLMEGLKRYVNKKDDRPWCIPSTFLNQERWDDEPDAQDPVASFRARKRAAI